MHIQSLCVPEHGYTLGYKVIIVGCPYRRVVFKKLLPSGSSDKLPSNLHLGSGVAA